MFVLLASGFILLFNNEKWQDFPKENFRSGGSKFPTSHLFPPRDLVCGSLTKNWELLRRKQIGKFDTEGRVFG